ncbi:MULTISPECIES: MFS transporter [Streptomyces]|uniref:MFS transporter n=1 Tax=Streptomyces evansiae TaxID=3075535 RepID=A0ABU2R339_9ACTN|nr:MULTISPECIES: MFS transporter [unclassified Streptomyces]MDT0411111.1 MFS transporter [Streptomyces sp. DSM 41979]MDT0424436.1 MFS transporter [Streptomyces sp. DSM 41859]MYQ56589.1 MFS transporter [Streptomyces sp. SID4926]WEH27998.1 MFS transporter [Streptomyces sp. AM 3-1-1]
MPALPHGRRPQPWSYAALLALLMLGQATSAIPSPLYFLYAEKWDYPPFLTTVIFAAYGAVAVVAILVSGPLSDRYGRRPVLLVAVLLLLAGLAVFVFAAGPGHLVVARMLNGLGIGAIVVVGGAALLDVSPERAARSGTLTAIAFNVGIAAAALGTAGLAQTGFHPLLLPYLADAFIALVLFVLLLVMREPHPSVGAAPLGIPRPNVPKEIRGRFVFAVIGAGAAWAVLGVCFSLEPSIAAHAAHVDGPFFGGVVIAAVALSAACTQVISARHPARTVALVGDSALAVLMLAGVAGFATGNAGVIIVTVALQGGAYGLAFGGSLRHLTAHIPAARRGAVMSLFYLLAYGALITPTLLVGIGATVWSDTVIFPVFSVLAALLCVSAVVVEHVLGRRGGQPAVTPASTAEAPRMSEVD